MRLPPCHSRRELASEGDLFFCAHPGMQTPENVVSSENCRRCHYWRDPPPEHFRQGPAPRALELAPLRGRGRAHRPWEGNCLRKPWEYRIAAAIPVLETPDEVALAVELLRLQTQPPFVMVIDTGSQRSAWRRIEALRRADVEVHALRLHGVLHGSDFPAMAMDLALTLCRSEYLFCTHADVFLRRRDFLEDLLGQCGAECPVVGYEITERRHPDWRGMVSHTATMLHMPTMDRIGAGWSLRRLCAKFGVRDNRPDPMKPNWPDTELLLNYLLRDNGIVPRLIGAERNHERTLDDNLDHCRSLTSGKLYEPSYYAVASAWAADAATAAKQRIAAWSGEVGNGASDALRGEPLADHADGLMDAGTVTLFVPLAGRAPLWPGFAQFLDRQNWSHDQTRLVLFDTSQNDAFSRQVREWVAACDYADVRHVRAAVGEPGLADRPRGAAVGEVTLAMTRIYNRLAREAATDYVWIVEDDVLPPLDACERLLCAFDERTASVSGVYPSRFKNGYVVWQANEQKYLVRGQGVQTVGGNGFGCVVLRGDVLRETVFTATIDYPAYDYAFYHRLGATGLVAKIDWSVVCDHRL